MYLKEWHVVCDSDGDVKTVELVEVPLWTVVVDRVVLLADVLSCHALCGDRMPQWAWRVTVGKPRYEEVGDTSPANSLGALGYRLFDWAHTLTFRHEFVVHRFRVNVASAEEAGAQAPDAS